MLHLIADIITGIYIFIVLIGFLLYKKLDAMFKIILWIIVYINIHENQSFLFQFLENSQVAAHLFCVVMTTLFFLVFRTLLKTSKMWHYLKVLFLIALIAIIGNSLFLQDIHTLPTISINIFQLFVVINACTLFLHLLNEPNSIPIFRDAVFWFNTSTFIYYSTSYFIFTIPYYLISKHINVNTLGGINMTMCLIYYPIIGYTFYLNANRLKYESRN